MHDTQLLQNTQNLQKSMASSFSPAHQTSDILRTLSYFSHVLSAQYDA